MKQTSRKYLVEFEQQKRQIAVILLIIVVVLGLIPSLAGLGLLMSFMTTSYSPGNLVFFCAIYASHHSFKYP